MKIPTIIETANGRMKTGSGLRLAIAALLLPTLVGSSFAANPVSFPMPKVAMSPAPAEREAQAERFVAEKLQLWQRRLGLTKWNVRARLVRLKSFKPKTVGGIHWDANVMKATIDVLSTYDYDLPYQAMLDDMENTVVHELVHLHLSILPRSDASRSAEEHAVNEITSALLKLANP
jgi:hypothetical protein